MVMRVGDHTLFASVTAKSSIDFKTADQLTEQIKQVLGDDLEKVLGGMELRSRLFNGRLNHPEADRLRNQLRDLYYFNEAWIPELKRAGSAEFNSMTYRRISVSKTTLRKSSPNSSPE